MRTEKLDKVLDEGIYQSEFEYIDAGEVSETFAVDDVVIQSPRPNEGYRQGVNTALLKYLSDRDVSVPEVVRDNQESPAFTVYERLDGKMLVELQSEENDGYIEAVRSAGETLAELNSVEMSGYGKPNPDEQFMEGQHDSWTEFIEARLDQMDRRIETNTFSSIYDRARSEIDLKVIPDNPASAIVHNDVTQDNFIVDESNTSHLIDLDNSFFGDPDYEFVRASMLMTGGNEELGQAFEQGYTSAREPKMNPELESQYNLLAVMKNAESWDWLKRNRPQYDVDQWAEGLQRMLDRGFE